MVTKGVGDNTVNNVVVGIKVRFKVGKETGDGVVVVVKSRDGVVVVVESRDDVVVVVESTLEVAATVNIFGMVSVGITFLVVALGTVADILWSIGDGSNMHVAIVELTAPTLNATAIPATSGVENINVHTYTNTRNAYWLWVQSVVG